MAIRDRFRRKRQGPPSPPRPGDEDNARRRAAAARLPRRQAPEGARNYVLLVLDSCRFDTFAEAAPRNMLRLGELQRRYSYATWTAPSHYNLLMGLLPHPSPRHVFASELYKQDFVAMGERLGVELGMAGMIPRLWLPDTLRNKLGYHTQALVSMPVLNPATPINADFDRYELMDKHNDLRAMIRTLAFPEDRPTFALLNTGETHYPYARPDEPESDWPRIHGVNGVFRQAHEAALAGQPVPLDAGPRFFDDDKLARLRARQVDVVRYLDTVIEELYDTVPENTWITITSDHGELFGEGGYFGHGPILHDKVMEVPFVEGRLR